VGRKAKNNKPPYAEIKVKTEWKTTEERTPAWSRLFALLLRERPGQKTNGELNKPGSNLTEKDNEDS